MANVNMLKLSSQVSVMFQGLFDPPKYLDELGAPLISFCKRPRVAIVGTRKITAYGQAVTKEITAYLAKRGVVIVSGLAIGTDGLAHQVCIENGGQTIAVLPAGLDNIYPRRHEDLAQEIINSGGTLISEYPSGTVPYPSNFLERNRLIAALSDGVIVIEAAARSGSINTANHALNLGKPVFAVPGNINSPMSEGCNQLIRAGAVPLTKPEDLLEELNWQLAS